MKLQLLLTGNEIMAGDIVDSNSSMIADFLGRRGWRIARKVTVGDELDLLVAEIRALTTDSEVLIINGGLGPTVDDLTARALAESAGQPLRENAEAMQHLAAWCERRGIAMNEANRKQAMLPEQADILPNTNGSAVGIHMVLNGCEVFATPGVPSELRDMMQHAVIPRLTERYLTDSIETRRLLSFGRGESSLQNTITERWPDWPESLELGFRASMPALELKLTARGDKVAALDEWQQRLIDEVLGDTYLGNAPSSLPQATVDALYAGQLRVSTAESCTGGLIAAQLTEVPGASQVFEAGWVTYANAIKEAELDVPAALLAQFGAVSREVAEAMAEGALRHSGADIAVAVTGIAGPEGGSEEKPVGTVWLALARADDMRTYPLHLPHGRAMFRQWVTAIALDLVRRAALGLDLEPGYLKRHQPR